MYACMTPVGFDTSDKFENHWFTRRAAFETIFKLRAALIAKAQKVSYFQL